MSLRQATDRLYTSIGRKSSLPSLSTHVKTRPSRTFPQSRNISSTCTVRQINLKPPETPIEDTPRWKQTPKALQWPFQIRERKNQKGVWVCNDDPRVLHQMYDRLIGNHNLLSEETRWLAITHKSFDQGKRGYNDRLSYIGKRIIEAQTSIALAGSKVVVKASNRDQYDRTPVILPQLQALENVSEERKAHLLNEGALFRLGEKYGLHKVIRWLPYYPDTPIQSGLHLVTAQALYAIIGALTLERGSSVANKIIKEKILKERLMMLPPL